MPGTNSRSTGTRWQGRNSYPAQKNQLTSLSTILHFRTLSSIITGIGEAFSLADCSEVSKVFGTTAAITLFASFFPGAAGATSLSTKSAYYGVRTANAFYNLVARDVFQVLPGISKKLCEMVQMDLNESTELD